MSARLDIAYEPIPARFARDGYTEFLIARQGDVVMYALTQSHGRASRWQYEVLVVRRRPACEVFGRPQPAKECLPKASQFGKYGWSLADWDRAWEVFREQASARSGAQILQIHPSLDLFQGRIRARGQDLEGLGWVPVSNLVAGSKLSTGTNCAQMQTTLEGRDEH